MVVRCSAILFALVLSSFAVDTTGTWKLNARKSTYTGIPKPKDATLVSTRHGDGWTLDIKGVYPDGKPFTTSFRYTKDGEEIPITGSLFADTLVLKNGNGDVVTGVFKRDGKVIGQVKRTVSNSGRTLTIEAIAALEGGAKGSYVAVYDKQ